MGQVFDAWQLQDPQCPISRRGVLPCLRHLRKNLNFDLLRVNFEWIGLFTCSAT